MSRSASVRRISAAAIETLESRQLLHAPTVDVIPSYNVPIGKTVQIPITASYDHSDKLTYTVTDDSKSVVGTFRAAGNSYVEMKVEGYAQAMVFQLFDDLAPNTVAQMKSLVNAGFYDGLSFYRVIDGFVIQGGDPNGGGTGFSFDDEFNVNSIFSGNGQLAMANSGKDANGTLGTEFFITEGPQRLLDFNHTIFGQLLRGESTRQAISNVPVGSNESPASTVRITSVRVIQDNVDGVLQIKVGAGGSATVTVTATGKQGTGTRTFTVTGVADKINDPPILGPTARTYYTAVGQTLTVNLGAVDSEGNSIYWGGSYIDGSGAQAATIDNGVLTITPKPGFTGKITLYVGVAPSASTQSRGSTHFNQNKPLGGVFDTQTITIAVGEQPPVKATVYNQDMLAAVTQKNIVLATFKDADPAGVAANWTAKVNWGDGTAPTNATITKARNGYYYITATKAYGAAVTGTEAISIDLQGNLGAALTLNLTATVRALASVDNGVLIVNGTNNADSIGIGTKNGNYTVTVNGTTKAFSASGITSVQAYAYVGNDLIVSSTPNTISTYLDGGDGDDVITGGASADVVNGGAGRDTISTLDGNDRVAGGLGNDTISGGIGKDRLFGGDGDDYISGDGSPDTVSGDAGNDTVLGGSSNDTVFGGTGNDILNGLNGADSLDGGDGEDKAKNDPNDIARISIEIFV